MKMHNEIEPDAPLTPTEKFALGLFMLWSLIAILAIGMTIPGTE